MLNNKHKYLCLILIAHCMHSIECGNELVYFRFLCIIMSSFQSFTQRIKTPQRPEKENATHLDYLLFKFQYKQPFYYLFCHFDSLPSHRLFLISFLCGWCRRICGVFCWGKYTNGICVF